jgi:hypothetical protein
MPLVPDGSDLCKDRDSARPTKKGGSHSHRPFEFYSAVIPGQCAASNYDAQLRI